MLFRKPVKGDLIRYMGAQGCFELMANWNEKEYEKMKDKYEFVTVTPIEPPTPKDGFINVYLTEDGYLITSEHIYSTREEADADQKGILDETRVACVYVKEGQFDAVS